MFFIALTLGGYVTWRISVPSAGRPLPKREGVPALHLSQLERSFASVVFRTAVAKLGLCRPLLPSPWMRK